MDSLSQTITPLQRAALLNLILQNNMSNNTDLHDVYALPLQPRNPYPRGSKKHTRRANINRNVRAHLRHDLQRCKEDGQQLQRMQTDYDDHAAQVQSLHLQFYSALNNFHFWQTDRQVIMYDQVLIFRWIRIFNTARSIIISATQGRILMLDDATVNQMTNLLWTQALLMKSLAANGTLSHICHRWSTPMNWERLQHFRGYLQELVKEPLLTPEYEFPIISREFITEYELDEESQIVIGEMAPPPIRHTWDIFNAKQHSR
jgi:hypothetical protein